MSHLRWIGTGGRAARARAARWALVSGGAGLLSGLFLILFYAVGRPFAAEPTRWSWFGPANDLTSAVQAGALIPVALVLCELAPEPNVKRWTLIGVSAMVAATILPVLLVAGLMPFAVQVPLVIIAVAIVYSWLFAISRAAARHGVLSQAAGTTGAVTSLGLGAALAAGGLAAVLPAQSTAQQVAAVAAGVAGAVAWLGFPLWTLMVKRDLTPDAAPRSSPSGDTGPGLVNDN